jgi:hypothetical protein
MDAIVFRHHVFQGADRGWEADPHGLADFTGHSLESGAQEMPLVTIPDFHFGQGQEIPAHVGPLKVPTSVSQPPLQLNQQDQGQKRAKHLAAYGGIPLVEDGPGVHHGLGGPEELLHQQQALVLHRHFGCGQLGVGAQDIFPVNAGLGLHLGLIEAHRLLIDLQEPPEAPEGDPVTHWISEDDQELILAKMKDPAMLFIYL